MKKIKTLPVLLVTLFFMTALSVFSLSAFAENPNAVEIENKITTARVGQISQFKTRMTAPEGATVTYDWTVSNKQTAIAQNGSVTFIAVGNVKITVKAKITVGSTVEEVTDSMDIEISRKETPENALNFPFTEAGMAKLIPAFVPDNTGLGAGVEKDFSAHWELTTDGTVKRVNDISSDPSSNISTLFIKDRTFDNFEATLIYRNLTGSQGWVGFSSGNNDMSKRLMDAGQGLFVQYDGKPTIWGLGVGGPHEIANPSYGVTDWHILKAVTYNGVIKLFIDDMQTPKLVKEFPPSAIASGKLGLTTSGSFEIKQFYTRYLRADGTTVPYTAVESFKVTNIVETAKVGETLELKYEVLPENATIKDANLISSNSNICIAKNNKLVFIQEGTVQITATSLDEPTLTATYEITVTKSAQDIKDTVSEPVDVFMVLFIVLGIIAILGGGAIATLLVVTKKKGNK